MSQGPNPLRQALWPLGLCYGACMALRNLAYDRGWKSAHALPVPVLSAGNLPVGGSGKTPTVVWLCEQLRARGRRPGVLARGYGRAPGARLNDEGLMLQRRLPWLLQEQDPDRVKAGRRLCAAGADVIVVDDGFQHRRLVRDLDLVCVDARAPFSNGNCLPAGDLREWPSGLRRASLCLLTRADGLDAAAIALRAERLRRIARNGALPIFAAEHAPIAVVRQPAGEALPLVALAGRRVLLLTAVARPDSVAASYAALGAEVVGDLRRRDHHRFSERELDAAAAEAARLSAVLATTAKDDARMAACPHERLVLQIGLRFVGPEPGPQELGL